MSLTRAAGRRLLPTIRTAELRMCHPTSGVPLRALLLVDVDLDGNTAAVREAATTFAHRPEGVHAVAWLHGMPVGEATLAGDPSALLPEVVQLVRGRVGNAVLDHLLLDAASTPGGLHDAAHDGLASVRHPPVLGEPAPSVSVAVCTRDRPEDLDWCLRSVAGLDGPVHEVVVVDNAPSDGGTEAVVARHLGVRYVREPRPGLDWARNRALLEATGDVVAFTDDDVQVHPRWVEGLRTAFREEPTALGVTGLVLPAELATPAQVLFETAGGFGRGYTRRWFAANVSTGDVAARVFGGSGVAGTGANMAFRREALLALGGFDPALDVGTVTGGGGDLEAFYRVVASGALLVYEPSAVVHHRHRRTMAELEQQMRGNGSGTYSIWLGAGRHYDTRQALSFLGLSWYWARKWHLPRLVKGYVAPELGHGRIATSETAGAVGVLRDRLYRRAQERAHQLAQVDAPSLPPLVRPVSSPRQATGPDPVVLLTVPDATGSLLPREGLAPSSSTRVRVVMELDGTPTAVFPVVTHGAGASPARLVREAVSALGPALLHPGHPRGLAGPVVDAGRRPAEVVRPNGLEQSPSELARCQAPLVERLLRAPDGDGAVTAAPMTAQTTTPGATDSLTTTVLLCTRGRGELLLKALAALAMQNRRPDQVLVVDNNDDPAATRQICAGHDVTVVHEPRPGLSRARNAGLPHVRGDVLVFLAQDVRAPVEWLENLVAPFADPAVSLVTGNVLPFALDSTLAQWSEDHGSFGGGPHRRLYGPRWLRDGPVAPPTWRIGRTDNAAVRMSSFRRVGAHFEVTLGPGCPAGVGEDAELFYRVLNADGHIMYEPTAVVLRAQPRDRCALTRQLYAYSKGHVAYHLEVQRLHGDRRGLRRLGLSLPRSYVARARNGVHVGAYPPTLLAVEVAGHLAGPWAWVRARRAAGRPR